MLWAVIAVLCVTVIFQYIHICHIKKQIKEISSILDDIKDGNLDRRLLANEHDVTSELIYKINKIVIQDKNKLVELKKSEEAYKKLVTSLSHDIRTPLASLTGYLEVLENETMSPKEHQEFLRTASKKASTLSDYIQSLFEWLKLESGEWVYDFQMLNICELTRLIFADWVIRLEEKHIKFQVEIPEEAVYLVTDQNAFFRIINNILANIVKHSHATWLSVRLKDSSNEILISITDNGTGISEKDLPHIFDRLYKCDTSRTESSNGLGLAIAKELTAALNGTIQAESSQGTGTTFQLIFSKNINIA